MSDESKFFKKCKCTQCSLPVSFPLEMLGKTIECPHCKGKTLLTEVKEPEKAPVPEKPLAPVEPPLPPKEATPQGIVHNLEYVGEVFLSLGFFGMVAAAISAAVMHYEGMDANETLLMIIVAITSFLPGLFIKNLFFALAEVIRLLRSINAKVTVPAIATGTTTGMAAAPAPGNTSMIYKGNDTIFLKMDDSHKTTVSANPK